MQTTISEKIDEVFLSAISKNITYNDIERRLSSLLSLDSQNKKQFSVMVISTGNKEPFFGMRIFPNTEELNDFSKSITFEKLSFSKISEKWRAIEKWVIEIDDRCIIRNELSFTHKELTAMLYHELGHVVITDEALERFYRAYREAYIQMSLADINSLKILHVLMEIPLTIACMTRNWLAGPNFINIEIRSDAYAKSKGYSEHLISAINKIIKTYGNSVDSGSDNDKVGKIKTEIKWANLNSIDLVKRKRELKDSLFYQTIKSKSVYMKALAYKILSSLGLMTRETYTGIAIESSIDLITSDGFMQKYISEFDPHVIGVYESVIENYKANYECALEAYFKMGKPSLPSQYDIDALVVEIDRISNNHDRIFVLDLVYDLIEKINRFIEYYEIKDPNVIKRHKGTIDSYQQQLEAIRMSALKKKNFDSKYKIFVKVPEGYEG